MLQDLDLLADRIRQLAAHTQQLKAERSALLARVKALETDQQRLQDELESQREAYASVAEVSVKHQADIEVALQQAEEVQAELLVERAQREFDVQQLKDQLQVCQTQNATLRGVANDARAQVQTILARLPGAPAQE